MVIDSMEKITSIILYERKYGIDSFLTYLKHLQQYSSIEPLPKECTCCRLNKDQQYMA